MENPKKYTSSVENSPFLDGDGVNVKAYSINQNFSSTAPPPPQQPPEPGVKQNIQEPKNDFGNQGFGENQYINDPVEERQEYAHGQNMQEPEEPQKEKEIPKSTFDRAGSFLALYESIVPPELAQMVQMDVYKVKAVFLENKQVPADKVNEIERFLKQSNKDIEEAFHFTPEQAIILKEAIAEVLDYYKLRPSHPLVNLLVAVLTVAVMQYFTVRALKKERDQQLVAFIDQFKITVPPGMEGAFKSNKKKLRIQRDEEKKEAA